MNRDTAISLMGNPFYAINLDPVLAEPHEPCVSQEDWIRVNVGIIEELGPEAYLRKLLAILQGDFPRSTEEVDGLDNFDEELNRFLRDNPQE